MASSDIIVEDCDKMLRYYVPGPCLYVDYRYNTKTCSLDYEQQQILSNFLVFLSLQQIFFLLYAN